MGASRRRQQETPHPRWISGNTGFFLELPARIELATFSLRVRRSTN
jgi:hypothetical protein